MINLRPEDSSMNTNNSDLDVHAFNLNDQYGLYIDANGRCDWVEIIDLTTREHERKIIDMPFTKNKQSRGEIESLLNDAQRDLIASANEKFVKFYS